MKKAASVLIVSRVAPGSVGGLASYQSHLAAELKARGLAEGRFFGSKLSLHPLWPRLASRPVFHSALQRWIDRRLQPEMEAFAGDSPSPAAVHFVGTGWDMIGFAALGLARKLGVSFTIWPAVHPRQWGDDHIDLRLYRQADAIFVQSRSEEEHLRSRGLPAGKAVLCGLPPMCRPDGDGAGLRHRLDLGNRPVVFFLGARVAEKGYTALLEAWPLVLRRCPEAVLLLGGPKGEAFAPLLAKLPGSSVRDLGVLSEADKADAYAACDVFCLPSAHESFGIVFPEAFSYGKPVICGPAPAPREWVKDGETGLHCEQTPEAIAEAILRLVQHPEKARLLGAEGNAFQKSHLTWEHVVNLHVQMFGLAPCTSPSAA